MVPMDSILGGGILRSKDIADGARRSSNGHTTRLPTIGNFSGHNPVHAELDHHAIRIIMS